MKNIVILTAVHPYKASGIVAHDLLQVFKLAGANVVIITKVRLEKKIENTISLQTKIGDIREKIIRRILNLFIKSIPTDKDYYMYGLNQKFTDNQAKRILEKLPFKPDIFIYLFPQFFLSVQDLYYLNKETQAPIFWYMMDMAAITGGCHYSNKCEGYTDKCGNCPGIYSNYENDRTHKNWCKKKKIINQTNIIPIAASEWQFRQLKNSSLFHNKLYHKILLPINNNIFKPGNKNEARKLLGLPLSKKIVFFGSVSVKEIRKGFIELSNALAILNNLLTPSLKENLHLIIAGKTDTDLDNKISFNHSFLGYLSYNNLALAFQAADIYISPSIEDSGPMMINQSIMCSTPVVSFAMGVALDLVITGETGYSAILGDSCDLANGIKYILDLNEVEYIKMRENCRVLSLRLFDPQKQAEKFNKIFNTNL